MGFASGTVTFKRFYVDGDGPSQPDEALLEKLSKHAIGRDSTIEADRTEVGWITGGHLLDTDFDFAQNVIGDCLHFSLRIDTNKTPPDLVRSYQKLNEQTALAASGRDVLTKAERQDARDQARSRADREAASGMHRRIKQYPVLWDLGRNELYLAATSPTVVDRFVLLFDMTFGRTLTAAGAGAMASRWASRCGWADALGEIRPSAFVESPGGEGVEFDQNAEPPRRNDFLGIEWLMWLWFTTHAESAEVINSLGEGVTVLFSGSLDLKCPFGITGSETIRADEPTRLPEARTAIRFGKVPIKSGLHMINKGEPYVLSVRGEAMTVGSLKLPPVEQDDPRTVFEERTTQLRHFSETLEGVFSIFLKQRLSGDWPRRLEAIRQWVANGQDSKAGDRSPTAEPVSETVMV